MKANLISLHGGHSGQYCNHAADTLEEIILQYIRLGFKQVGITEHIPPVSDDFRYPDEIEQGLFARDLSDRFDRYIAELKGLKKKYADRITIWAGMETETVTGFKYHVKDLVQRCTPDYIVGSVHHVNDICFDYSPEEYQKAAASCGSVDELYLSYFDLQYDMINALTPFVVGHFDLIRIYDPDYIKRMARPDIAGKITRNLELIASLGLVLDYNLRPLARGEKEPYLAGPVLEQAKHLYIRVVPGDDSHGIDQAGNFVPQAVAELEKLGFSTQWPTPELFNIN